MRTAIRPENVSGIHRLLFELFSLIIDTHTQRLHVSHNLLHVGGSDDEMKQEAQLMLTNPRDAFRGQSSHHSPNMVPFDMLGMVSCYSKFVPKVRRFSDI